MSLPLHENHEKEKYPIWKEIRNIFFFGLVIVGSILFWVYFIKFLIWIL